MTRKDDMIRLFEEAISDGAKFIFTEMDLGYEATEIIINTIENVKVKLNYLCKTYNDDLNHPHAPVSIVSYGYFDNMSQLDYVRNNFKEVN